MSERRMFTAFFIITALLAGFGAAHERLAGRAEQKKWDADYFAAHPVVKEVQVPTIDQATIDLAYSAGANYVLDKLRRDLHLPAYEPKAQKGSKRRVPGPCELVDQGIGNYPAWTPPCSGQFMEQPVPQPVYSTPCFCAGDIATCQKICGPTMKIGSGEPCSINGREWFAPRADGMCYSADAPASQTAEKPQA